MLLLPAPAFSGGGLGAGFGNGSRAIWGKARCAPLAYPPSLAPMRVLILTLGLLLAWLQYRLWVGEGSLAEVHALKSDIARQTNELTRLRARNQALAAEVADLKSGNEALEERARMDLGMIKQGEVFLQVIEGKPGEHRPETARLTPPPVPRDARPSDDGGARGRSPASGSKSGPKQ
jgi:cell division protein FtsB